METPSHCRKASEIGPRGRKRQKDEAGRSRSSGAWCRAVTELWKSSGPFKASLFTPGSQTHKDSWNPFLKSLRKENPHPLPGSLPAFSLKPEPCTLELWTDRLVVGEGAVLSTGLCPVLLEEPLPAVATTQGVSRHCSVSPGTGTGHPH